MERLSEKIDRFERTDGTVADFNEVFTDVPLTQFLPTLEVEIGEPDIPVTTRLVTVGGLTIRHSFVKRTESEEVKNV